MYSFPNYEAAVDRLVPVLKARLSERCEGADDKQAAFVGFAEDLFTKIHPLASRGSPAFERLDAPNGDVNIRILTGESEDRQPQISLKNEGEAGALTLHNFIPERYQIKGFRENETHCGDCTKEYGCTDIDKIIEHLARGIVARGWQNRLYAFASYGNAPAPHGPG